MLGEVAVLATFAVALDRVGSGPFGVIVLGQSLSQWPYLLESGIGQVVNRLLAGQRRDDWFRDQAGTAVAVYGALGLASLVGGLAVSHLLLGPLLDIEPSLRPASERAFDFMVVGAAVKLASGFVPRALVGQTRLGRLRAIELVRAAVALAATVALVGDGGGALPAVGFSLMLGDLAASAVGLVVLRPRQSLLLGSRRPSRAAFADQWRSSKPLLLASALSLGWTKTDAVIVGIGLGPVALTTYGVVVRIYELLRAGMELLFLGVVPSTTRYLDAGDRAGVGRIFRRSVAYVAMLVWPVAATVAVFTPQLVDLWLQRGEFPGVWPAMAVAMALVAAITPAMGANFVLVGAGVVGRVVGAMVRFAPLNLAMSIALLGALDVSAVFVGTLVGTLLLLPRYLAIVADVSGMAPAELLAELRGPTILLGLLTLLLVGIRLLDLSDTALVGALSGCGVAYAAAALRWLVPRQDLRRLLP